MEETKKKFIEINNRFKKYIAYKPRLVKKPRKKVIKIKPLNGWTDTTHKDLEKAFAWGCTVSEACLYANISTATYSRQLDKRPELRDRYDVLRTLRPILIARKALIKSLPKRPDLALKLLERWRPEEFREPEQNTKLAIEIINTYATHQTHNTIPVNTIDAVTSSIEKSLKTQAPEGLEPLQELEANTEEEIERIEELQKTRKRKQKEEKPKLSKMLKFPHSRRAREGLKGLKRLKTA